MSARRPPRYSGLPSPDAFTGEQRAYLERLQELVQNTSGMRGNPKDRVPTLRELEAAGLLRTTVRNSQAEILGAGAAAPGQTDIGQQVVRVRWRDILDRPEFVDNAIAPEWSDIRDKPTEFPPSAHSHPWGEVTDKPTEFPPSAHSHPWSEVTDKPTEFPPSAHSHVVGDTTGLQDALDSKEPDLGLPGVDGHVLSSLMDGTRSWIAPPAGGGGGGEAQVISRGATWISATVPIETPVNDVYAMRVPFDCVVENVTVGTLGGIGDCSIDVLRCSFDNFPPSALDSITGVKPIITGATKYFDDVLTNWNTGIYEGDVLAFHLESSTGFTGVFVTLQLRQAAVEPPVPLELWTPALMETAQWLDMADPAARTLSGSTITAMLDKSGNAIHMNQQYFSRPRPIISVAGFNGLDAANFDQDLSQIYGALPVAGVSSVYVAIQRANAAPQMVLLGGMDIGTHYAIVAQSGSANTTRSNNDAANSTVIYVDGATLPTFNWGTFYTALNNKSSIISMVDHDLSAWANYGLGYSGGAPWTVQSLVGELVAVSGISTTGERQRIEGYLAWKWGLEANLPVGHPYELAAPTTTEAWTPADITTALWLDAADTGTITIETGISQWDDKSGNARHAVASVTTKQPEHTAAALNGLHVVRFDGTSDAMTFSSQITDTVLSVFAVANKTAVGSTWQTFLRTQFFQMVSRVQASDEWGFYNGSAGVAHGGALGASHAILGIIKNSTTNTKTGYNGTWLDKGAQGNASSYATGSLGHVADVQHHPGDIAELIFVPGIVSDSVRDRIEGYLAWKWGLQASLPPGHQYELAAPTI